MKYVLLVYLEEENFAGFTPEDGKALDDASKQYDESLMASGHFVAAAALGSIKEAVTIRARKGTLTTTDGPFAETKEHLGGFILIEARDLNEAIRIAEGIPIGQYGRIEVRPAF